MKNAQRIATMTKKINSRDRSSWIDLYYSIEEDAVYTTPKEGRTLITRLINPNTKDEIVQTVVRALWM